MKTIVHVFLAGVLLFGALMAQAQATNRMALVIGIDKYRSLPKLEKAVGDARAMTTTLESLGFAVTRVLNASRQDLNIAIDTFASKLKPDDLAFIHFSGHGVEIDGENFLLPADVPKPVSGRKGTVKYEAISLRRLIAQIAETGVRARVFVLDACRDNPFEQVGARSIGSSRGLARTEAPAGTFIMYSAAYRQVALDKLGPDDKAPTSVFTRVLLDKLAQPGKPISHIAREVRSRVQTLAKRAGHTQRPAYYDELSSKLVLKTIEKRKAEPDADGATKAAELELAFWNSIKDSAKVEELESYLKQFPNGTFARLARLRAAELRQGVQGKVAKLQAEPSAAPTGKEPELRGRELARSIQKELQRVGCSAGRPDGAWGRRSRGALRSFSRHANVELSSLDPSPSTLQLLRDHKARACPLICSRRHVAKGGRCVLKACPKNHSLSRNGRCVANKPNARAKAKAKPKVKKVRQKRSKTVRARRAKKTPGKRCGRCMVGNVTVYWKYVCGAAYMRWCKR